MANQVNVRFSAGEKSENPAATDLKVLAGRARTSPSYRWWVLLDEDAAVLPAGEDGFRAAAWGDDPGRWPLPAATDPLDRWHRAVALGGQGRYSAGCAELDEAERTLVVEAGLRSLMASTRASWFRQMGAHVRAARYDGAAIALVGLATTRVGPFITHARCDALTGLAADALGVGRFSAADALLTRCEELVMRQGRQGSLWRQQLRLRWVRAELAMVSGDGAGAVRHALDARELATETDSLRHITKTELIVAAAVSSLGDIERSRHIAHSVLDACSEHGLVPLRWAAAMLTTGLGDAPASPSIIAECAALLHQRGGVLADG